MTTDIKTFYTQCVYKSDEKFREWCEQFNKDLKKKTGRNISAVGNEYRDYEVAFEDSELYMNYIIGSLRLENYQDPQITMLCYEYKIEGSYCNNLNHEVDDDEPQFGLSARLKYEQKQHVFKTLDDYDKMLDCMAETVKNYYEQVENMAQLAKDFVSRFKIKTIGRCEISEVFDTDDL